MLSYNFTICLTTLSLRFIPVKGHTTPRTIANWHKSYRFLLVCERC